MLQFWPEVASSLAALRVSSPRAIQQLTRHIVGQVPKQEVAERAGVNRTTLARWLSGSTEPRLPEFLRLVDATTQRLLQFVAQFADPAKLSSTRLAYRDLQTQEKLAHDLPLSHAVLRALELVSYRALPAHDPGFLGRQIGLDPKAEEHYLSELAQSGQIRWDGTHWVVERVLTVDTRKDPVRNRQLKAHWAEAGALLLKQEVLLEGRRPRAVASSRPRTAGIPVCAEHAAHAVCEHRLGGPRHAQPSRASMAQRPLSTSAGASLPNTAVGQLRTLTGFP
jgi:transcriptional regulator with XRE-family HTH domain